MTVEERVTLLEQQIQVLTQRLARLATSAAVQELLESVENYKSDADQADAAITARLETIEAQITDALRRITDLE